MELLRPHLCPPLEATVAEQSGAGSRPSVRHLSRRQPEILHMVALGLPNKQVGKKLGISEGTVRKHLENAYARLGVRRRTEAAFLLQAAEPGVG